MRNTFQISADIKKKAYISEPMVTQNDDITFIVNVFDNGEPFSLAGVTTASLANTRMDGTTVVTPGTIINDNTIQFDLGTNETAVPGKVLATVQLYDEDERVSTIAFTYRVVKDPTGSGYVPSENEKTLIEVVLNDGPLVIQQAQDAAAYATTQGDYAKQVADENKTRWLNPVATFADIATTYPNPQHGDTVMVTNDGENTGNVYRYENGQWKLTQKYNDLAITGVQNKIFNLLKIQQQTDFVDLIKKRVGYNRFRLRKLNSTQTEIVYDDGNKHITYRLNKDPNDDYVKINKVYAGDVGDLVVSKYDITSNDITGTWNASSMAGNNWYTQDKTTPATFTARVTGTTIKFVSYTDDRGGIWEFVVDGDTANKVTLSTWSQTPQSTVQQTIKSGLEYKEHTVVATFKGDDPNHVPSTGAGTARGWVYVNPSLSSLGSVLGCIKASNPEGKRLLVDGSNKEFAFSVTYNGVTNWIPEHYGVGTVFKIDDIQYVIDNVVTDISTLPDNTYIEFKASLVINQHCYCRISDTDIAELWLSYYFNKDGSIKWSGKLKALQNFTINDGYPLMLPVANETFSEIVTGLYNSRISDYSGNAYYFEEERDLVSSCCAIDVTNKDYIVACKLDNIMQSMRLKDTTGKPVEGQSLFLSQRTDFPKIYYVSFQLKDMNAGEIYIWGGEIIAATINNAYELIK